MARLRKIYGDRILDTLLEGEFWTEYSMYMTAACLKGDLYKHHYVGNPPVYFIMGIWSRKDIIKANETLEATLKNGVPMFIQLQDDSGFSFEEIDAFYHKVARITLPGARR